MRSLSHVLRRRWVCSGRGWLGSKGVSVRRPSFRTWSQSTDFEVRGTHRFRWFVDPCPIGSWSSTMSNRFGPP